MSIAVIGMGYVGLVTLISLAEAGNKVIGIEKDEGKLEKLKLGISPIYEPGIQQYMKKHNFRFEKNYRDVSDEVDVIFICVGTPQNSDGSVNLNSLYESINEIIDTIKKDTIVVIKSTVPVGTNKKIKNKLREALNTKVNVEVVSNPEFLSQGTAIYDALNPQRIVLGVESKQAINVMKSIYNKKDEMYIITDFNTSEIIKYACNSFLALKISYMNEIANICQLVDANIEDVEKGMETDCRIGKYFLKSGVGYGGSCLPKDTIALKYLANCNNYDLKTVASAIQVNDKQKNILVDKARKYYKDFKDINVSILGLTFKPDTDDVRESPAIGNIQTLLKEGANIKVYDPVGNKNMKKIYGKAITYCSSIEEAIYNSQICFIFTQWDCIKQVDLNIFNKLMKKPIIMDGRNCFRLNEISTGIIYESIGRRVIK